MIITGYSQILMVLCRHPVSINIIILTHVYILLIAQDNLLFGSFISYWAPLNSAKSALDCVVCIWSPQMSSWMLSVCLRKLCYTMESLLRSFPVQFRGLNFLGHHHEKFRVHPSLSNHSNECELHIEIQEDSICKIVFFIHSASPWP